MDHNKGDRMDVFTVIERGERNFWVKVGSAFVNRDASLSVVLEALPLDGRLQVRPAEGRERDDSRTPRDRAPDDVPPERQRK